MAYSQKPLRDHLVDQQDPFVLRTYLSERRILCNKFSMAQGSCKSKEKVSRPKNALKFILDMFFSNSQRKRVSSNHNKIHHGELRSSSCRENQASSLARISPYVKESIFNEKQATAGIKLQWRSKDDGKLSLSPALSKVSSSNKDEEAPISSIKVGAKEDGLQIEMKKIATETEDGITDSIIQETIDFLIEQNRVLWKDY